MNKRIFGFIVVASMFLAVGFAVLSNAGSADLEGRVNNFGATYEEQPTARGNMSKEVVQHYATPDNIEVGGYFEIHPEFVAGVSPDELMESTSLDATQDQIDSWIAVIDEQIEQATSSGNKDCDNHCRRHCSTIGGALLSCKVTEDGMCQPECGPPDLPMPNGVLPLVGGMDYSSLAEDLGVPLEFLEFYLL